MTDIRQNADACHLLRAGEDMERAALRLLCATPDTITQQAAIMEEAINGWRGRINRDLSHNAVASSLLPGGIGIDRAAVWLMDASPRNMSARAGELQVAIKAWRDLSVAVILDSAVARTV